MTIKKRYDDLLRKHGDADKVLRDAQRDLAERTRLERRMAEVDAKDSDNQTEILDVPLLAVEKADGVWVVETTTQVFASMSDKKIVTQSRSIPIAITDIRQGLKERLVEDRYCKSPDKARRIAALANCWVAGRVPYSRIVSK